MFWREVAAVATRTLLLQRLWRHCLSTVLEVSFVVLCFYAMLEADVPDTRSLSDLRRMESASLALGHTSVSRVLYAPRNDYTEELVKRAFASVDDPYLKLRKNSASETKHIYRKAKRIDNDTTEGSKAVQYQRPGDFYVGMLDRLAVLEGCQAASSPERPLPCVHFSDAAGGIQLRYDLILFVPDVRFMPASFRLGSVPLMRRMFFDEKIFDSTFRFQQALDTAHANMQWNQSGDVRLYHVFARRLPDPLPISDGVRYRNALYVIVTLAYAVPFVRRIHEVSYEIATGMKDHQTAVGLSPAAFWTGHFMSAMTLAMVEGACVVAVMTSVELGGKVKRPYFDVTDPSLLLATFFVFSVSHTLLAFLVAAAVPLAMWSETIGLLVFAFLPAWEGLDFLFDSLGSYLRTSRFSKLRIAGFYPCLATTMVLKIMGISQDFGGKLGWNVINKKALDLDNVTIVEIWSAMLACNIAMVFLMWYLPHVLPWATASPRHPLFLISPLYWMTPHVLNVDDKMKEKVDQARFEPESSGLSRVIIAKGVTQVIRRKIVLRDIHLNIYASQVTVLSGPSGAGKTTLLRVLAGLVTPTKGSVEMRPPPNALAEDVSVAMCQQGNVLFDELTVREHLSYFGMVGGCSLGRLQAFIEDCLRSTDLLDVSKSFPSSLREAMKRRLCVAIALITQPMILFLDEPTTGMDAETRRNIWDIISSISRRRTVVVSSHEMAEADSLAHRIVILHRGEVVCDGSPAFLKNACSAGFKLCIGLAPGSCPHEVLLKSLRDMVPKAVLEKREGDELIVSLETREHRGLPKIIRALEENAVKLGILTVVVSVATMKDLYARITDRWLQDRKEVHEPDENTVRAACTTVELRPHAVVRFYALLVGRFYFLFRSLFTVVAGWIVPVLVFSFAIYVTSTKLYLTREKKGHRNIDLRFESHFQGANIFLQAPGSSPVVDHFTWLLQRAGASVTHTKDAYRELRTLAREHYDQYSSQVAFGGIFNEDQIELWHSPYSPLSKAVGLGLLATALTRAYSGQPNASIVTTLTAYNSRGSRYSKAVSAAVPELTRNWIFWSLVPTVGFGFLSATFVLQPASERLSGARTLLTVTGVSRGLVVVASFAFDLLFYAVPMGACFGLYAWLFQPVHSTLEVLLLAGVSFAPVAILGPYAISELANNAAGAYSFTVQLFAIAAPAACVAYAFSAALLRRDFPRLGLSFFPPFAFGASLVRTVNLEVESRVCDALRSPRAGSRTALRAACPNISVLGPGFQYCCEMASGNTLAKWDAIGPFSMSEKSIVGDLAIMLAEGCLLFIILCIWPPRFLRKSFRSPPTASRVAGGDVARERAVVERVCAGGILADYALVVKDVSRFFGSFAAVRGVSLAVRPGECLGLLGVSGSGKTALLNMIAGITPLSSGNCYSNVGDILSDLGKWQSNIGVCPYPGGFTESMHARGFLRLVGRLRGIPAWRLADSVESMISLFDLEALADIPHQAYTLGDKRRLSIAAALLNMPPIVLLDDPYAGVDFALKKMIAGVLKQVRLTAKTSILLATHSMEDCEMSCDRVAVMTRGEISCIGPLADLKKRFAKGYTVQFVLQRATSEEIEAFKSTVAAILPELKLREVPMHTLEYYADNKIQWPEWFEKTARLSEKFVLEHVYMSDTISTQIIVVIVQPRFYSITTESGVVSEQV